MKNIYLLPTDKPSRLHFTDFEEELVFTPKSQQLDGVNIYITSDEEIKEGDWGYRDSGIVFKMTKELLEYYISIKDTDTHKRYKIILTTDQDLIKDGVQAIDDEFLEWFVKNPSCEEVKVDLVPVNEFGSEITINSYGFDKFKYKIIIPKKELIDKYKQDDENYLDSFGVTKTQFEVYRNFNKQKTLEEAALRLYPEDEQWTDRHIFTLGAKWQQEQDKDIFYLNGYVDGSRAQAKLMYSEEDLEVAFYEGRENNLSFIEWFEQFKNK